MEYKALVNFLVLSIRVINRVTILVDVLDLLEYEFLHFEYREINVNHFEARNCLAVLFSVHPRSSLFLWFHVEELNQFEIIFSVLELLGISHFKLIDQYFIKTALPDILARLVLLILLDEDSLGRAIVSND